MDSRTKTSLLEKEVQTKNALINELVDQINELKYLVNALMSEQQRPESVSLFSPLLLTKILFCFQTD